MTSPESYPPEPPRAWERPVTLVGPGGRHTGRIAWSWEGDHHRVVLDGPTGRIEADGRDFFDALAAVRRQLEPHGWYIAVQGARRDTFPSGMLRDTGARRVYVLEPGRPWRREHMVRTFDDADPADLGTVAEQEEFYERWLDSVFGPRDGGS
jgi:hypothetical protein